MAHQYLGSCLCGAIQYEIHGDFESFYLCHCQRCRKGTGSAHAANLFSTTAKLSWLKGEAQVTRYHLPETMHQRSFCSVCGTAVPTLQLNGKLLVVPAGSLDSSVSLVPNAHIFTGNRADWDKHLETVPEFEQYPEE